MPTVQQLIRKNRTDKVRKSKALLMLIHLKNVEYVLV